MDSFSEHLNRVSCLAVGRTGACPDSGQFRGKGPNSNRSTGVGSNLGKHKGKGPNSNRNRNNLVSVVDSTGVSPNLKQPLIDVADVYEKEASTAYSPLKWHNFVVWLHGYDKAKKDRLLDYIANGIRIPSSKVADDDVDVELYNHKSALSEPDFVRSKIQEEIACHRVAGPFTVKPPGLIISPLSCVPKGANDLRLVHNLSFPYNDSVNSSIDRSYCVVEYETLDTCIDIIAKLGPQALMAKADVQNAFRVLKVHKLDYKYTGFSFDGLIYWDKNLPFGCSVSCQLFEELSTAVQWILREKLGVRYVSHILDDFMLFGHKDTQECHNSLQAFIMLANSLGLPLKQSKTFTPCTK